MKKSIEIIAHSYILHVYRAIGTLALLILSLFPGRAGNEKIDKATLDKRINDLIKKYNIPDAELAVIRNDSVIYLFTENPANADRNYLIGSCSKSFTALSVMILAERGKIDIDKPVRAYLPWFVLKDTINSDRIKVRHLLNQTSGIGSQYGFFDYPVNDFSIYKIKLIKHLSHIVLINQPGTGFCYSNLNYLLLGLIAEAVAREKYTDFLSDYVFPEIGMKMSYAGFNDELLKRTIQPYQYLIFNIPFKSKIYPHSDYAAGYGYISSNATDLCNYLKFMINKGVATNGDTLISSEGYNNLVTPVKGNYAMGWMRMNYNKKDMVIHTGLDENYSAILSICPEDGLGIVAVCNVNSLEFCSMAQTSVMDMMEGKPFFNHLSFELILRWLTGFFTILAIILSVLNMLRWKKYYYKIGFIFKPLPLLRLICGIGLSAAGIILVRKYYSISIFSVFNFQPDIVLGFTLILIFGIMSSFTRYFGTYSKSSSS